MNYIHWPLCLALCLIGFACRAPQAKEDIVKVDLIVPEHGMADPHAWVENDTLFVICGHDESWEGKGSFRMDRWEIWSSADLKNWDFHRSILPTQTYIGDQPNCWAGDVCERNGKYYWFFSNRNLNTGVMVADEITGVYRDLLGEPLLPKGIVPVHPYDPEVFIEDGVYTICFGAGTYYMATLAEDMKSLSSEPRAILVQDQEGNALKTEDKASLFKRNDWYYLVYGSRYAMAKNLYGPYTFQGPFLKGGHTSFFNWKGQWYVLQENHDISAFFRGASLKPVFFNEDETIHIPDDDRMYPGPGREWDFERSTMGWQALHGTRIEREKGTLGGNLHGSGATIVSAPWLYTDLRECDSVRITLRNLSDAKELKLAIFSRDKGPGFWRSFTDPVDWPSQKWVSVSISSRDSAFKSYTLALDTLGPLGERLMQLALQPASQAREGRWEIDKITVK